MVIDVVQGTRGDLLNKVSGSIVMRGHSILQGKDSHLKGPMNIVYSLMGLIQNQVHYGRSVGCTIHLTYFDDNILKGMTLGFLMLLTR